MEKYKLQSGKESDKIFVIKRSEIEGRIEAEYYKPSIRLLEYKIRKIASKKLKDFALKMASGATPSVTEEDTYYSDKENGIPFLRVQNLQTNGELALEDVKYINKTTHQTKLKRSQVAEHDLLVKITGVGRMAIASVAPDKFVGNTNQHMVVIKTASEDISRYLAKYLNLDIVEKLASRRSTGATRPALDYPALKSIPIVEGINFLILEEAFRNSQTLLDEANLLFSEIDKFLLTKLEVILPVNKSELSDRIFTSKLSEVFNDRFDAPIYTPYSRKFFDSIQAGKYPLQNVGTLCNEIFQGVSQNLTDDKEIKLIKVKNILSNGRIDYEDVENVKNVPKKKLLKQNDIIAPFIGEAIRQIKFSTHKKIEGKYAVDNNTGVLRIKNGINPEYVEVLLNSSIGKFQILRLIGGGVPFIGTKNMKKVKIPIPNEIEIQEQIAKWVIEKRKEAFNLVAKSNRIVDEAKKEIETKLL